ncbi:universal stress protein [Secundilactobacillus malefermentans]|uniref:Universal stress protein n=1 Tax=Secundilactobacillus malefermentans TaxID=176292 RepID=A0A4R5NT61_9LACO|nr:universal stress protein [Secundilactobacillus malefermentans]KRM59318.1 hypothetical protein FD44_GL001782 [Secundilactobacillus malefermentans DSM 5705 = KCTC 3548]QEA31693.1 universal stress protein [Secundilactobacillus malefermentans]TDG79967.1 hypothetical protein C5L31_002186 [Secundilactobacillus malefermentans]
MLQHYEHLLVPVDGSNQAEHALLKAMAIAKRNNASIELLSVIDVNQYGSFGNVTEGSLLEKLVNDNKGYLQTLADQLKDKYDFTDTNIHVRFGNPKSVISFDFEKDHPVDLIVMGATGMNAVNRIVVGSVTSFVNRNAKMDVLIVRTDSNNKLLKSTKN